LSRATSTALGVALLHVAACAARPAVVPGARLEAAAVVPPAPRADVDERRDHREPSWQDALPPHAPIQLGLRPPMLQGDRIYGPLWRHALGVARARSRVVAGTRLLEAVERAEEVRVHLDALGDRPSDASRDGSADMVVVVRGVPGDVDPGTLVDPDGHLLWSAGPFGPVRELVHEQDPDGTPNPASLFELPGRTWVIASGPLRARARDAFVRPQGRPEPPFERFESDALAVLVLDGPTLVARVGALGANGGLASLGHGLESVAFELRPGVEHEVRAVLTYQKEDDAAAAEHTLGDLKGAIERKKPPWLMWYEAASVERIAEGPDGAKATLRIDAPLPAELIDAWLQAGQPRKPGSL
jgi:hypothetical protein